MVQTPIISSERSVFHAYIILGIGVAATSMAATFIKLAQAEAASSILIACGRLFIAALLLTPSVIRTSNYQLQIRRLSRRDLALTVLSGVFLAIHFAAWVSSLEFTSVLISVVLVTTTPIWVALLEVFFLKARLSPGVIMGLCVALIGGIIIGVTGDGENTAVGNDTGLGASLSLIGSVAVAVYLVIGRRIRSQMALTPYIWMVYGIAALILLVAVLMTETRVTGYSLEAYVWILALAIFPQLIGHSSFNFALAYLPATYISVATQLEPVFGSIIAFFVLSEVPGWRQVIGGVIIVIGVLISSVGSYRRQRRLQSN